MTSSSYTWAGRKLTPQELISSQRTDPLPHIVKLTQVPSEYEKSCPQMANGTVLWLYGSAEEERVALKTSDKNPKYISVPLETPIKFEVVHTHEHGPPTLLSSMLRGKVQSDLKVEMAGNAGNRLSPTPDQTQSVPYGSLQVVGIYKEGVLQAQTIINVAGELNPLRRNLSVNCPVHLDIATGLYGKSAEEFQKLKERLKKNQSSKATNQTETSYEIYRLSNDFNSIDDANLLAHIHCLHAFCSESSETRTQKTQPPKVKAKPGPKILKAEVGPPEVTQQEVAEVPQAAQRSSIAGTCRDPVTRDVLYESFETYEVHSSFSRGDAIGSSPVGGGPPDDDGKSPYENLSMISLKLDKEPYLNEEELKAVMNRKRLSVSSSKERDSIYELPKHCSYVHGLRPTGKDKQADPGETGNPAVERIAIGLEEASQAVELEEDEPEQVEYETIMSLKPVRRSELRTARNERPSPTLPIRLLNSASTRIASGRERSTEPS